MAITKTEGGIAFPPSAYLVVEDPAHPSTWHLRFKDENGINNRLLGACHAALLSPAGYRGNPYEGPQKQEAIAKLKRLYAQQGLDWPGDSKATTDQTEFYSRERVALHEALEVQLTSFLATHPGLSAEAFTEYVWDHLKSAPSTIHGLTELVIAELAQDYREEMKTAADPGVSDVHVPGAIGVMNPGSQARTPTLRKFLQKLRSHFTGKNYMTQAEMEGHYRSALGHAGGKAKAAADPMPGDMELCAACAAIDPADVPATDCTCSCCEAGDTADCLCAAMVDEIDAEPAAQGAAELDRAVEEAMVRVKARMQEHPLTVQASSGETFRLFVEAPELERVALGQD